MSNAQVDTSGSSAEAAAVSILFRVLAGKKGVSSNSLLILSMSRARALFFMLAKKLAALPPYSMRYGMGDSPFV